MSASKNAQTELNDASDRFPQAGLTDLAKRRGVRHFCSRWIDGTLVCAVRFELTLNSLALREFVGVDL
jgi:hypothetical protein